MTDRPEDLIQESRTVHAAAAAAGADAVEAVVSHVWEAALMHARTAFATAFSRSGYQFGPELVEDELAEMAEHAQNTFRRFRDAFQLARDNDLDFPLATVESHLALLAGTKAIFGEPDSPTARDIVNAMRQEDITSPNGDQVRMHLFCEHGNTSAIFFHDRLAVLEHKLAHQEGCKHPEDSLSFQDADAEAIIAQADPAAQSSLRAQLHLHRTRWGNPPAAVNG